MNFMFYFYGQFDGSHLSGNYSLCLKAQLCLSLFWDFSKDRPQLVSPLGLLSAFSWVTRTLGVITDRPSSSVVLPFYLVYSFMLYFELIQPSVELHLHACCLFLPPQYSFIDCCKYMFFTCHGLTVASRQHPGSFCLPSPLPTPSLLHG